MCIDQSGHHSDFTEVNHRSGVVPQNLACRANLQKAWSVDNKHAVVNRRSIHGHKNSAAVCNHPVYRLTYNGDVVAFKMGRRQGGPSRTGVKGAYLNRYVTDEQRSRRPIFNATLRAAAGWPFFRVARSTHMNPDMGALPPVRLGPPRKTAN